MGENSLAPNCDLAYKVIKNLWTGSRGPANATGSGGPHSAAPGA